MRVLTVFGTRPEAIKLAPVLKELTKDRRFQCLICNTGQQRHMTDQVLRLFKIRPHFDLGVMTTDQTLPAVAMKVLARLTPVLKERRPDVILVQGDTTTTFAASLAAHYQKIPVAHVEAGLRSGDLAAPFPEEAHRRMTSCLASLHFAPTKDNALNLRREGIPSENIVLTGSTVVDTLLMMRRQSRSSGLAQSLPDASKRLILVTGHRRESFGRGLENICKALKLIAARAKDILIIYPVHFNPHVRHQVRRDLAGARNVRLLGPLDYERFIFLLDRAYFVLTDSGGVQEEAAALGKPVLVMRKVTDRPEALRTGGARLVGTDSRLIVAEAIKLLEDERAYERMAEAKNPFGDGAAAPRIVKALHARFRKR